MSLNQYNFGFLKISSILFSRFLTIFTNLFMGSIFNWSGKLFNFFFNSSPTDMWVFFKWFFFQREEGKEKKGEILMWARNISWLSPICPLTEDQIWNRGMCPDHLLVDRMYSNQVSHLAGWEAIKNFGVYHDFSSIFALVKIKWNNFPS